MDRQLTHTLTKYDAAETRRTEEMANKTNQLLFKLNKRSVWQSVSQQDIEDRLCALEESIIAAQKKAEKANPKKILRKQEAAVITAATRTTATTKKASKWAASCKDLTSRNGSEYYYFSLMNLTSAINRSLRLKAIAEMVVSKVL